MGAFCWRGGEIGRGREGKCEIGDFKWLSERFIYIVTTEKRDAGGENGLHLFFCGLFF